MQFDHHRDKALKLAADLWREPGPRGARAVGAVDVKPGVERSELVASWGEFTPDSLNLMDVAKVNGAGPVRAFFEVVWPLNRAGTMIGLVLVFIPTLGSSVTSQFLGGPDGALFGNILAHQFGATGTWAFGSAMGVVLFAISILVILIAWRVAGDLRRSGITLKGLEP